MVDALRPVLESKYTFEKETPENIRSLLAQFILEPSVSALERQQTMKLLGSRFPVNLYTGSNTKGLPVINGGTVKTLTEMPLIFHYSKINLNITSKSIRSGLPLRIFDILGCGGFLLTNYQPELSDYFTPGYDLVCYSSEDELLKKTEYYLSHEKERIEIAQNGLQTVTQYHNYPERLLQIISMAYGITKG